MTQLIIVAVVIKNRHLNGPIVYQQYKELLPCNVPSMTTLNKIGQLQEVVFPAQIVKHSNAIGYVTSNFIGQLHLHVLVNFTFYFVENCVIFYTHTLIRLLFKLYKI
jgi:hypothetical protein